MCKIILCTIGFILLSIPLSMVVYLIFLFLIEKLKEYGVGFSNGFVFNPKTKKSIKRRKNNRYVFNRLNM